MSKIRSILIMLLALTSCSSPQSLSATVQQWDLSPAGRIEVLIEVTNDLDHPVSPYCTISVVDLDGVFLASDGFTADEELAPGDEKRWNVQTGLKIEEDIPGDVQVECTG